MFPCKAGRRSSAVLSWEQVSYSWEQTSCQCSSWVHFQRADIHKDQCCPCSPCWTWRHNKWFIDRRRKHKRYTCEVAFWHLTSNSQVVWERFIEFLFAGIWLWEFYTKDPFNSLSLEDSPCGWDKINAVWKTVSLCGHTLVYYGVGGNWPFNDWLMGQFIWGN